MGEDVVETVDEGTRAIRIRRCEVGDAPALSLVGQATFLDTFAGILNGRDIVAHCIHQHAVALYERWLQTSTNQSFLAETRDGAPIGYLVLDESTLPIADAQDGDYELKRIYLLSRYHGSGTGQALMDQAVAAARQYGKTRLLLGVYAENARALAFYAKNGFRTVGERRFQVGDSRYLDAIMARPV